MNVCFGRGQKDAGVYINIYVNIWMGWMDGTWAVGYVCGSAGFWRAWAESSGVEWSESLKERERDSACVCVCVCGPL